MNTFPRPLSFALIATLSACTGVIGTGSGPATEGGGAPGTGATPGSKGAGGAGGDDNFFVVAASYFSISAGATSAYHDALESALTGVFADATRRAAIFSDCVPASPADTGCYTKLISRLGHRAWRRELTTAEAARYVGVATGAASMLRDPL